MMGNGSRTIQADLKRMAPVWGLVVGTALVVVLMLRTVGAWHLRSAAVRNGDPCSYAEIHYASAMRRLIGIRELAAAARLDAISADPTALSRPSLGSIPDSPDLESARRDLLAGLDLCPEHSLSYRMLSLLEWYSGNEAAAYTHLGTYHRLEKRPDVAAVCYEKGLEVDPEEMDARLGLASIMIDSNDLDQARVLVSGRDEMITQSPEGLILLGRVLFRLGDYEKAESHFREGLLKKPGDRNALREIGELASITRQQGEIADFLVSLGDHDRPAIVTGYHNAAYLYREVGDLHGEEKALRGALRLAPNNAGLHFDLSACLYKQGRLSEARDAISRATEIDVGTVMRRIQETGVDPRR